MIMVRDGRCQVITAGGADMGISLRAAQAMIDRAGAHAAVIGVPMNIAVTDGCGHIGLACREGLSAARVRL
jgi:hypothetical protein